MLFPTIVERLRPGSIALWAALAFLIAASFSIRFSAYRSDREIRENYYTIVADSLRREQMINVSVDALRSPSYVRKPPLYPMMMALSPRPEVFYALQIAASSLFVLAVFHLGRLWRGTAQGLLAAIGWTFWGPAVAFASHPRPENLFWWGLVGALIFLTADDRGLSPARAFLAGACVAAAELTRTVLMPFGLSAALALLLLQKTQRGRKCARNAGIFLLGLLVPTTAYAYVMAPVGSGMMWDGMGQMLLSAALDEGGRTPDGSSVEYVERHKPPDWDRMSSVEQDRAVMGMAWNVLRANKGSSAVLAARKVWRFWFSKDYGFSWDVPIAWIKPSPVLSIFAVVGLAVLMVKRSPAFWWSVLLTMNFSLMAIVVEEKSKFRESMTPWYLVLAAIGMVHVAARVIRRTEARDWRLFREVVRDAAPVRMRRGKVAGRENVPNGN
ncbi:MAG: hypothetical protein M5R36_07155 [Deltaproteobacteria bacterium]|nr:hypothetical protein [Deltaproteobacteria bacterium]